MVLLIRLSALLAVSSLVGCGVSIGDTKTVVTTTASAAKKPQPPVPQPPVARFLPARYRATKVTRAELSGDQAAEAIVTSIGPPASGSLGLRPADLQVLSWDPIARHWTLAFDAQQETLPLSAKEPRTSNSGVGPLDTGDDSTIIDPQANTEIGPIRVARFLPGESRQLVFSTSYTYGGSGVPGMLAIVDFDSGVSKVVWAWSGDGGIKWALSDLDGSPKIKASAEFWSPTDAHCCPVRRSYDFEIAADKDFISIVKDERAWLGAVLSPTTSESPDAPVDVIDVVDGSPAARVLKPGDQLVAVSPAAKVSIDLGPKIFDQILGLNAGTKIKLSILRNGAAQSVELKLGSLIDESVFTAPPAPEDGSAAVI